MRPRKPRWWRRILVATIVGLLATALTTYLCVQFTLHGTHVWRWDHEGRAPNPIDGGQAAGGTILTPLRTWHHVFLELDANTTRQQKDTARSRSMFVTTDDFESESPHVAKALRHTRAVFGDRYDDLIQHAHRLDIQMLLYGFPARTTRGGNVNVVMYDVSRDDWPANLPEQIAAGEAWVNQSWYMPLGGGAVAYLPIGSGIAINSAFYATIWLLLTTVPTAIRRKLRRRRGLCPRCKYDLHHDHAAGCPECGWNRAEARAT